MNFIRRSCLALFLLLLSATALQAQIEQVTFNWQSPLCPQSCETQLRKQLEKINGVSQVSISPGSGQAALSWKSGAPFSFSPLNSATRMVGIRIHNVHVKVTGKIQGNGSNLKLRSDGDGTSFTLISPPKAQPGDSVILYNPQAYPLSAGTLQQLAEAQRANLPVTVQGGILQPERAPPLYLVVGDLQVQEPAATQTQAQRR